MAKDWSDNIIMADLSDEPQLSDDFNALYERIAAAPPGETPAVVLNFGHVTYVNSSNLAQLLRLRKQLADAGSKLRVCSVTDEVWSVLMVTGLDKVFQFAPDPMTALAGLQIEMEDEAEA
ncbi:MAG: STAS domain-containing protein [Planctomycetota bacterium]